MKKTGKRKKLTKAGRILTDIILIAALITAGYAGWNIYTILNDNHQGSAAYEELASKAETGSSTSSNEKTVDFSYLSGINPNIQAWITLDDSNIDYPAVQYTDNSYYLTHLFNGEYNSHGCIFIDSNNQTGFADKNTVVYGHHMHDGTMFADVENYKNSSYYAGHKQFDIYTPDGRWVMYPVAGLVTTADVNYIRYTFTDDDDYLSYVNSFVSKSTFTSEESITASDQMMTLSTCSYDVENGRYVLIGKLVKVQ
jgi:sortase B